LNLQSSNLIFETINDFQVDRLFAIDCAVKIAAFFAIKVAREVFQLQNCHSIQ
jgi:hypothetical protein